jgi:hypothetical protein
MPRGSLPGERRGGRQKGTPNRATAAKADEIAASGMTPLDYLVSVYRDRSGRTRGGSRPVGAGSGGARQLAHVGVDLSFLGRLGHGRTATRIA